MAMPGSLVPPGSSGSRRAARPSWTLAELSERHPIIYWAYDIWYTRDDSGNPVRSEVEARLLADDQIENIARRVATEVEIIEAYERLFFNVRERLADRGYLMHCVLGPAVHLGFQAASMT